MSVTTPGKVRDIAGLDEDTSIDDAQLISLIGVAEKIMRRDVLIYRENIIPGGNPATGATWNGSNTSFSLNERVFDGDFDRSTDDDCTGVWLDSTYAPQTLSVVVSNARYGRLTIKQSGGITALPASAVEVKVDYYTNDQDIPFDVLEDMGTYLTAHLCQLRLTEPRKVSLVDLESNKRFLTLQNTEFLKLYQDIMVEYQVADLRATA